jgi:hypothetical protein
MKIAFDVNAKPRQTVHLCVHGYVYNSSDRAYMNDYNASKARKMLASTADGYHHEAVRPKVGAHEIPIKSVPALVRRWYPCSRFRCGRLSELIGAIELSWNRVKMRRKGSIKTKPQQRRTRGASKINTLKVL